MPNLSAFDRIIAVEFPDTKQEATWLDVYSAEAAHDAMPTLMGELWFNGIGAGGPES